MDQDDERLDRVMQVLEIDHQYVEHFDPWDTEGIAALRSLGRKAGRRLGWKVRTFQTEPERREDGKVVVGVMVIESTPEDDERMRERGDLLMRQAFKFLDP